MGKKLFVGNLNFKTNDSDLRELFGQAGTVDSAMVMMDRATGRSRGFGFVEMSTEEEAQKAVQQFNSYEFQGRNLNVNEARERTPGAPRGGGYGGGYSGGGYGGGRGGDRSHGGDFSPGPNFGGDDFGGSPGFGGGFNRGNFKPRKEGGSRRGLRAKKRSL